MSNQSIQKQSLEIYDINLIIYFLTGCGIICSTIDDISGIIIPRDNLLNNNLYEKFKTDIPKLKVILHSNIFTAVQKNADIKQRWPLINLIRQILRKYNYQLIPKRVCDGYKDGKKKYKRYYEIKKTVIEY